MKKYKSIAILACMLSFLLGEACSDRNDSRIEAQETGQVSTAQTNQVARIKVEDRVWEEFSRKSNQIVLVSVHDPLAVHSRPACRMGDCPVRTDPQTRSIRMARLAATKSNILGSLDKAGQRTSSRVKYLYPHFSLMALEVNREAVSALAAMPDVTGVFFDRSVPMKLSSSVPFTGADEYQDADHSGAGTGVAVLDTAIRYWYNAFGDCSVGGPNCKIKAWENFTPDDPTEVANSIGHGTNVAGIVLGMAPDTAILGLNVFWWHPEESGYLAEWSDITAALDWVAEHQAQYNIVATNMSLGGEHFDSRPCNSSPLYDPLRTLWADYGVLNAIATGNEAQFDWVSEPGCISLAVSVGAQYDTELVTYWGTCTHFSPHEGEIVCFSNLNGFMDLLAPGVWITAAGLSDYSGTSMATPHVAGAIALLQGYWLDQMDFQTPYWAHKLMKLMALPHHHGGRVFSQMELTGWDSPDFALAWSFDSYFKEVPEGLLPFSHPYTKQITVGGEGWDVGGVYLYLEVIHPYPDNVQVTLQAPDGTSVSTYLPGGGANFNAVLGRDYFPALFADMAGGPVDGIWTLTLEDSGDEFFGYYLNAALFWTDTGCTPNCPSSSYCGDDLCGGTCGNCGANQECMPDRTCDSCSPSCSGNDCGDDGCGGSCGGCDDGLFCNGMEGCVDGYCESGALPCDSELNPCLTCDEVNQDCILAEETCFIEYECFDDGATHPDDSCLACDSSVSTDDWTETDCDDGNPCTDDTCDSSAGCQHTNNTAACDDGNACTGNDVCSGGSCAGVTLDCNDENVCTDDSCDPSSGCQHENNDSGCDDGDACTSNDGCVAGQCVGTSKVCEDNDICTDDGCDPGTGECVFTNNVAVCDDGNACTGNDVCSGGSCAGTSLDCDDGNPCTDDACDPASGCVHVDNNQACDDGDVCTENDACTGGTCLGSAVDCDDGDPCTDDSCDPVEGCQHTNNTASCDDGNACTENDACSEDSCSGTAMSCDDDNPCTNDSCDIVSGCLHTANDSASCDDANLCTQDDSCQGGSCSGTQVDCSALNDGCLRGICDADTGDCRQEPVPDGTACDDGDECTNGETCLDGSCIGGEDTCDDGSSPGCNCGSAAGRGSLLFLLLGLCLLRPRGHPIRKAS